MKKWSSLPLALALAACLSGCGGQAGGVVSPSPSPSPAVTAEPSSAPSPSTAPTPAPTPSPTPEPWTWEHGSPEEHRLDGAVLTALHDRLDDTQVQSCVIGRDGKIVDEYFKEDYGETTLFTLQSCSKSVTSAMVGIAIEQGYLPGVDVPIADYFPQLLKAEDERLQDITIRHLLTHTSGLQSTDSSLWSQWRASDDWVAFLFERPLAAAPGTTFDYSTGNTHLLSVILEQATGMSLMEYGRQVLFGPMEMDSVQCGTDPQGNADGGNGFSMNVYDMAKFGQLYLDGGVWRGEQLVPADWVEQSTTVQFDLSRDRSDYGYQWWARTFGQGDHPAYFAQGHWGQFIFVVPDLELVVVFTSHHEGSSDMYWQFVNDIVDACAP